MRRVRLPCHKGSAEKPWGPSRRRPGAVIVERTSMRDEEFMQIALRKAAEGVARGQTPFGAALVKDGAVVSCEHNRVWSSTDITAHAEILALREACRTLSSVTLENCTMYSTCEPCPMCFSACHWARVSRIVFGARIEDAKGYGFRELSVSTAQLKALGHCAAGITADCLRDESLLLFEQWRARGDHRAY